MSTSSADDTQRALWNACDRNNLQSARSILRADPHVSVNWKDENGVSCLHAACRHDSTNIPVILLIHPDIDPDPKNRAGETPFLQVCVRGYIPLVRLFLSDSRVLIHRPQLEEHSPLRATVEAGQVEVIKWIVASGRELNLQPPRNEWMYVHAVAGKVDINKRMDAALILNRFVESPQRERAASKMALEQGSSKSS
jgi:ankyrin repeat protein